MTTEFLLTTLFVVASPGTGAIHTLAATAVAPSGRWTAAAAAR